MPSAQRLPPWPDLAPLGPILDAANIVGLFEWHIAEDRIFPCLGMAQIFGLDRSTVRAGAPSSAFVSALHPDDRAAFSERMTRPRIGVERTVYRIAPSDRAPARTLLDITRLSSVHQEAPDWACGALFDYPGPARTVDDPTPDTVLAALDRAAGLAVDLRRTVQDIGNPTLHRLVDMVLVEIASALARQMDAPQPRALLN